MLREDINIARVYQIILTMKNRIVRSLLTCNEFLRQMASSMRLDAY